MSISVKVTTNPEVKTSLQNNSVSKTVGVQNASKLQSSFSIDASEIPVSLDNSTATNVRDALNDTATAGASQTLTNKTIDADNNTISNLEKIIPIIIDKRENNTALFIQTFSIFSVLFKTTLALTPPQSNNDASRYPALATKA